MYRDANLLKRGEHVRILGKAKPSHSLDSVDGDRVENRVSTRTNRFHPVIMDLKDLRQQQKEEINMVK